jgi:hypothetical protein
MASIACTDCGHHRHRCPSNTKYCRKCRLLRDVEFWADKTRTCRDERCEQSFTPTHRHDAYCGHHQLGQTANLGPCVFCNHERSYRIAPDVNCCERCARDATTRKKLIRALRKGQAQRIENPPTEPLRQPKPRQPPVLDPHELDNAPVI